MKFKSYGDAADSRVGIKMALTVFGGLALIYVALSSVPDLSEIPDHKRF